MHIDVASFAVTLVTLFVSGAIAYYVKVASNTDREIKESLRGFEASFQAHVEKDSAAFQKLHDQIDRHVTDAHTRISKVDIRVARLEERSGGHGK